MLITFNKIAVSVLNGEYTGVFRLRNYEQIPSTELVRNPCPVLGYDYPYILGHNGRTYTANGIYYYGTNSPYDVVDFIKD